MPRTETIRKNFFMGPRPSRGLIEVAKEITEGSENTAETKQQANEDYYQQVKQNGGQS